MRIGRIETVEGGKEMAQPLDPARDRSRIEHQRIAGLQQHRDQPAQGFGVFNPHDKAVSVAKGPVAAEGGMPTAILHAALIGAQLGRKAICLDRIAPFCVQKDVGWSLDFPHEPLASAKFKRHHLLGDTRPGTKPRAAQHVEKRSSQWNGALALIFIEARLEILPHSNVSKFRQCA